MTYQPSAEELIAIYRHQREERLKQQRIEHQAFNAAYPEGAIVRWMHGQNAQEGRVLRNASHWWSLTLQVQNLKTHKIVSIADYDLID